MFHFRADTVPSGSGASVFWDTAGTRTLVVMGSARAALLVHNLAWNIPAAERPAPLGRC